MVVAEVALDAIIMAEAEVVSVAATRITTMTLGSLVRPIAAVMGTEATLRLRRGPEAAILTGIPAAAKKRNKGCRYNKYRHFLKSCRNMLYYIIKSDKNFYIWVEIFGKIVYNGQ